jgi:MFS family permease
LVLTASQIVLADITLPAERGRAMGLYSGVFAFAVGAGPLPGGVLAERFGLQAPFLAYAVAGAIVAVLTWLRLPETRGSRLGGPPVEPLSLPNFGQQVRLLGANRAFLLISLVSFAAAVARTGALFNVVPLLVRDRLGLAPDQIGLGLSLVSLGGLLLAYPSGVLVDRLGRKTVIAPATLVSALAAGLFALAPSYAWYLIACGVWSISLGISSAAPAANAADTAPPGMNAAVISTNRMLSDAGYVLGPLILGIVSDAAGAPAALSVAAALLALSAVLFGRLAPETRPRAVTSS